jgi:hypothetical protein
LLNVLEEEPVLPGLPLQVSLFCLQNLGAMNHLLSIFASPAKSAYYLDVADDPVAAVARVVGKRGLKAEGLAAPLNPGHAILNDALPRNSLSESELSSLFAFLAL